MVGGGGSMYVLRRQSGNGVGTVGYESGPLREICYHPIRSSTVTSWGGNRREWKDLRTSESSTVYIRD